MPSNPSNRTSSIHSNRPQNCAVPRDPRLTKNKAQTKKQLITLTYAPITFPYNKNIQPPKVNQGLPRLEKEKKQKVPMQKSNTSNTNNNNDINNKNPQKNKEKEISAAKIKQMEMAKDYSKLLHSACNVFKNRKNSQNVKWNIDDTLIDYLEFL